MNVNTSPQGNETFPWTWTEPIESMEPIPTSTLITLYSILLVWSLLGNVLVIAVVYCNQNLRTNMNYLIVNMAVSDLLVPLVAMPYIISRHFTKGEWLVDGPFGAAFCKLVRFFTELSPFVSSISLVIIAFQRFMAVVYPTRGQLSSRKTRWIAISFPWILAMALFSPFLYIFRLTNEPGFTMCYILWDPAFDIRTFAVIYLSLLTALGFAVPLIVSIILYIMIIYKVRRSLDNVRGMMNEELVRSRQRRNNRIFGMLITVIVLFTICWCPYLTFIWLPFLGHLYHPSLDFGTFGRLLIAFHYIWYLFAAINPCIYFVFLKDFRQGLKSLCCRETTSSNEPILRQSPAPGGDSNQDPTCTPPHINTTSV